MLTTDHLATIHECDQPTNQRQTNDIIARPVAIWDSHYVCELHKNGVGQAESRRNIVTDCRYTSSGVVVSQRA